MDIYALLLVTRLTVVGHGSIEAPGIMDGNNGYWEVINMPVDGIIKLPELLTLDSTVCD